MYVTVCFLSIKTECDKSLTQGQDKCRMRLISVDVFCGCEQQRLRRWSFWCESKMGSFFLKPRSNNMQDKTFQKYNLIFAIK